MQYLIISFFVVFPLFIRLAIGFVLGHTRIMSTRTFREMNNVTFRLFLPVLIFSNIYQADLTKAVSVRLIVFAVCARPHEVFGLLIPSPGSVPHDADVLVTGQGSELRLYQIQEEVPGGDGLTSIIYRSNIQEAALFQGVNGLPVARPANRLLREALQMVVGVQEAGHPWGDGTLQLLIDSAFLEPEALPS